MVDITSFPIETRSLFDYLQPAPVVSAAASIAVDPDTGTIAIQRVSPATTAVALPTVASRAGRPLRIVDWSSGVTDHAITVTPDGAETIMRAASWPIYSNASQLASITLYPSTTLSGWYIAP